MRASVDPARIHQLIQELGRRVRGPGRIYLTGGASALLEGWRDTTVDIDLKIDPEPPGVFEAIAELKTEMDINIELAAPDHFLPVLPDWQSRSRFIDRHGEVDFFHYDFRAQALSKLARGHDRDARDVRSMLERGLVERKELAAAFEQMRPDLIRFPALDIPAFERRVRDALEVSDA